MRTEEQSGDQGNGKPDDASEEQPSTSLDTQGNGQPAEPPSKKRRKWGRKRAEAPEEPVPSDPQEFANELYAKAKAQRWTPKMMWAYAAYWAILPVTLGQVVISVAEGFDRPIAITMTIGFWAGWSIALALSIVRRPSCLTAVRVLAATAIPAAIAMLFWAGNASIGMGPAATALIHAVGCFVSIMGAPFAELYVNGISYGRERRYPLRAPSAIIPVGVPLAWAVLVVGVAAWPLLLASRQWFAAVVGAPLAILAVFAWRALNLLSHRWAVFVPNGFVFHDALATREPVFISAKNVVSITGGYSYQFYEDGNTPDDDCTMGAGGLAVRITLRTPVEMVRRSFVSRHAEETLYVREFFFTPTMPGKFLRELMARNIDPSVK